MPPRRPRPAWRWTTALIWLILCGLALWSAAYLLIISDVQYDRSQHELQADFRQQLALGTVPTSGVIAEGTPIAQLNIPRLGLKNQVIIEGTSSGDLRSGPGHVRSTPLPGEAGTSQIDGRSLAFGGPFRDISTLRAGDVITVTTDLSDYTFHVIDVRHKGDPTPTAVPAGSARITLVSAKPSGIAEGWVPGGLVYVDADLKGKADADPGGRPAITSYELPMHGQADTLTFTKVVLWLQLLASVGCVIAWLATRWGRWQVWLVGVPIILAVVWGLSSTAVQLLPNLL